MCIKNTNLWVLFQTLFILSNVSENNPYFPHVPWWHVYGNFRLHFCIFFATSVQTPQLNLNLKHSHFSCEWCTTLTYTQSVRTVAHLQCLSLCHASSPLRLQFPLCAGVSLPDTQSSRCHGSRQLLLPCCGVCWNNG